MTTTPCKIRIRGLYKAFSSQTVLAGVDLDIPKGSNLVLLGGSGAGKTVLAKCLLGLIEPDAGSIQIDGRETSRLSSRDREALWRKTGVLFQNGALFDSLPIWRNITFALIHDRRMDEATARDIAIKALAEVGLGAETADLMPAELSGGMQKRVALARAIVGEPEIVVLDSPTDGLDPIVTTHIDALIVRALKRLNATALTITHDIASARRIGDRVAFLSGGRIAWEGPMEEVDRTDHPELLAFLGRAPGAAVLERLAAGRA
jgi:phospholipid/cholesterol/gamma-HCH transport system ATP-binding protein